MEDSPASEVVGKIMAAILMVGYDDDIKMFEISDDAVEILGSRDPVVVRAHLLDAVERLLSAGLMVAGDRDERGVQPWNFGVAESMARIHQRWDALAEDPSSDGLPIMYQVCFFEITPGGQILCDLLALGFPEDGSWPEWFASIGK